MTPKEQSEQEAHRRAVHALREAAQAVNTFRKCMWGGTVLGSLVFSWGTIHFKNHYALIAGAIYGIVLGVMLLILGLAAGAMLRTIHRDLTWNDLWPTVLFASVAGVVLTALTVYVLL
jgi:uncharacterized membrane protein